MPKLKDKPRIIAKNTLTLFTHGNYSDFGVLGLFKALKNIDVSFLRKEFEKDNPDVDIYDKEHVFTVWLIRKKYFEEVTYSTLYTGSYGDITL